MIRTCNQLVSFHMKYESDLLPTGNIRSYDSTYKLAANSQHIWCFILTFKYSYCLTEISKIYWCSSAKHLDTFWYLWLTWSSWEQSKQIQESPQEPYKLITLYLGATCTSEIFLFKLGLLTFYLLFSPFLAWFQVNILKRKHEWVQVI